jgi:hypothetical protein
MESLNPSAGHAGKKGWWFDPEAKTLNAMFLADDFALEITKQ